MLQRRCRAVPRVSLVDLRAGDVLNSPVLSPRGVLLAAAATVLGETHLALFASWDVREADIVPRQGAAPRPLDPARIEDVKALLDDRFSLVQPLTPLMSEARGVAEELLIARLQNES